jgi:hypothetical protein
VRGRVGFAGTLLIALTAGGLMQFVLGVLALFHLPVVAGVSLSEAGN